MIQTIILIAVVVIAATGCHAKDAIAPKSDVEASSSGLNIRTERAFPAKTIHIGPGGNKFFLWKLKTVQECPSRLTIPVPGSTNPGGPQRPVLGACPDDISFVLHASNDRLGDPSLMITKDWAHAGLTALDDATFRKQQEENNIRQLVLSKAIHNSQNQILAVEDLITLLDDGKCDTDPNCVLNTDTKALATATSQQQADKTQQQNDQTALDAELQKPTSEQDPNKIAQLKADIASLTTKIANLQKRIDLFNNQITDIKAAPQQVADNMLEGPIDTFRTDDKDRNDISNVSNNLLQEIKNAVDFYDYADNLTVDFGTDDYGKIMIDVQNWDFRVPGPDGNPVGQEGELSFSTADGSITGATYTQQGGTYEFDLHGPDGGNYHFKVSRTRYGAADGLAHFNGDIVLTGPGIDPKSPRRGVAVMDEQVTTANNNASR